MSVARFNFSHGDHAYHQATLDNLRIACKNTRVMCATMLDTKGPEIRTGELEGGQPVTYTVHTEGTLRGVSRMSTPRRASPSLTPHPVTLTSDYTAKGNARLIALSYRSLAEHLSPGSSVLISDGSLALRVLSCDAVKGTVNCICLNTATLGERKNVNLPGVIVDLPVLTAKDEIDLIEFAVRNRIDFVAASFVRRPSDLDKIRSVLGDEGASCKIISKIENQEGLQNFDAILAVSDGIMVARGDLGMEIPTSKIFLAQKTLIHRCCLAGKPVVTATQMLESMVRNPRPTRAEATDVANAVLDGTDAVMLSGETAAGKFPVECVRTMSRICAEAEHQINHAVYFAALLARTPLPMSPLESLASNAVAMSAKINASLIIVLTRGGTSARLVAKYRPKCPVLTVAVPSLTVMDFQGWACSGEAPARHALLMRGLLPLLAEGSARASDADTTDDILRHSLEYALEKGLVEVGGLVVALHRIASARSLKIIRVR